jgi:hypothetical protein
MKNWDEKNGTAVKQMKSIWNIPFTTPSEKNMENIQHKNLLKYFAS